MFKYIFCLIAILMQPIFAFLVFHKQEKQKAALKMPLVYLSGVYLVIQIFVFFKVCLKIPKDYQVYSYLLQSAILAVFIIIEIAMAASNKYITKVQTQEQSSIEVFKGLIQQLEICRVQITDEVNRKEIDKVLVAAMVDKFSHKTFFINMTGQPFRVKETQNLVHSVD